MKIPKIFNKAQLAQLAYPSTKSAKTLLSRKINGQQGAVLTFKDRKAIYEATLTALNELKEQCQPYWAYFNDKFIEARFEDEHTELFSRDLFAEYVQEMDYNIFHVQVAEDDFKPYTPSDKELLQAENEFWDKYFKIV